MEFRNKYNALFEHTQISDLFFTDYISDLDPLCVKIYLMCLYFTKTGRKITKEQFASELSITSAEFNEKLVLLEAAELIFVKEDDILLQDINQKKLERCYKSRTSGAISNEFTMGRSVINARSEVIKSISDTFFGGQMPSTWFPEIEEWFDAYNFGSDVMYMLFQHCLQNGKISMPYVRAVAKNWGDAGIQNPEQLEEYLSKYDLYKTEKGKVIKTLKLNPSLDMYSESILKKWFMEYGYDFETVEIALKNATKTKNPGLNYFDAIITCWHNENLKTKKDVEEYEKKRKARKATGKSGKDTVNQKENYTGRGYDEEFLDNLFKDMGEKK